MASVFACRVPHVRHYLRPASTRWISFATTENLMEYDRRYGMILTVQKLNLCKYLVMRATNFINFLCFSLFIYATIRANTQIQSMWCDPSYSYKPLLLVGETRVFPHLESQNFMVGLVF